MYLPHDVDHLPNAVDHLSCGYIWSHLGWPAVYSVFLAGCGKDLRGLQARASTINQESSFDSGSWHGPMHFLEASCGNYEIASIASHRHGRCGSPV